MEQPRHNNQVRPTNPFIKFEKTEIEQSIPERFEKQVAMYPDRLAVKDQKSQLTYDELNQMANRVAQAILEQRGEGEEPIALRLDGVPVIIGILSVLKAGKIYVPLAPSYPHDRIAYILKDSQADLIVTDNKNLSMAQKLVRNSIQLLNIDELDFSQSIENLNLPISPDTITWILYTSGSTGQPKGVIQNHRNVLHFTMNYTNNFHICADDRLILLYSCSANMFSHEVFSALLNGASLYRLNVQEKGLASLADWLVQQKITIYSSVPTVFHHFLDNLTGRDKFPSVRLIKMIGEPVYRRDVELYKKYFSEDCLFVNRLGSSETGSIRWYFITKETQIASSNVPVGYPVEDNEILLLDDDNKEVGFNQVGEIAVKSRYLSLGYWRKPHRTQSAFLPNPDGRDERIYLTGDMGLMLSDGCLIHMGRKDFQIKIRGHRVEVAEIETVLMELDTIKEAAVAAREDRSGDQRLIAYLVPAIQPAPTVTTLRRVLAAKLPDYMIPATFVMLDSLPLTPTGKIDRRVLPEPGTARPELENPYVAPRTPVEETLVEIWKEVLHLDELGIQDNFLELGGHSLLATQIVSRVIKKFQVEVLLKSLFAAPTVADMALVITLKKGFQAQTDATVVDREEGEL